MNTKFCTDILTGCLVTCFLRKCEGQILYLRQHNLHVVENFKGQTLNNVVEYLMTSEVKGHFHKVEDNPLK